MPTSFHAKVQHMVAPSGRLIYTPDLERYDISATFRSKNFSNSTPHWFWYCLIYILAHLVDSGYYKKWWYVAAFLQFWARKNPSMFRAPPLLMNEPCRQPWIQWCHWSNSSLLGKTSGISRFPGISRSWSGKNTPKGEVFPARKSIIRWHPTL